MTAAEPIGPQERNRLFESLRLPLAIAVSGGPDSMALMHLVAGWARSRAIALASAEPAPIIAITIDHGLRPGSAEEARWVAAEAARMGLSHVTLQWRGSKPRSAIQEAARSARYELLLGHCGAEDLPEPRTILLAHHQEDQAETVLMRLGRGSGIDGLSGMRPVETRIWLNLAYPVTERRITLLRPLLDVPKARLIATLDAAGLSYRDDPSNRDLRFERVRLRSLTSELAALGLDPGHLALSARRVTEARDALEAGRFDLARRAVQIRHGACAVLDLETLGSAPRELVLRLLQTVVQAFGGRERGPDRAKLDQLAGKVKSPAPIALTLGGAMIETARGKAASAAGGRFLRIYREPGRGGLPARRLAPGQGIFWDRRFYVSLAPAWPRPVEVAPLGLACCARLRRQHLALETLDLPRRAAATLPAIWDGDDLLAVPALSALVPNLAGPAVDGGPAVIASFAPQHIRAMLAGQVG
jgi:tRNA(Ile)-lysidine synthase